MVKGFPRQTHICACLRRTATITAAVDAATAAAPAREKKAHRNMLLSIRAVRGYPVQVFPQ